MIKGHSGAGPRNAEREPPVLRLHDEYPNSTSSASPPTPTLSISSSDDNRRPGLSISSMRDDSHYHPPLQPSLDPYHAGAYSVSVPFVSCQLISTAPRDDTAYSGVESQLSSTAVAGSYLRERYYAPSI